MKNKNKLDRAKQQSLFLGGIGLILLLLLDQITKWAAWSGLKDQADLILIPGVFELHYLENQGAAFGMFENMQWIFVVFAVCITALAGYYYYKLPMNRHFLYLRLLCIGLMAGALGNMLDRILHGYVIDFLYVSLIDFPIFNIADIYVCVSTALLLILLLFYYKEEDYDQINGKKTKQEYMDELIDKIQECKK